MIAELETIAGILASCERDGTAPCYIAAETGRSLVHYAADGRELLIVSDFHVAGGILDDGNFPGTENFFADDSFVRFLQHFRTLHTGWLLVINGDFTDFLRVDRVPATEEEFAAWGSILTRLGIHKTPDTLKNSILPKERTYGLRTDDYKSVWKLGCMVSGHQELFASLADWLLAGERIIIVKGNHDLEWYWLAVRNHLRLVLAEIGGERSGKAVVDVLREDVLPGVFFVDDAVVVDEELHIEHGHLHDKFSTPVGKAVLSGGTELNIPFGSFFNRYLLNKIEVAYPFVDNVRPGEKLLPLLIRERFSLGMLLLFEHIPFLFQSIQKRYFQYMFSNVLLHVLALGLPVGLVAYLFWGDVGRIISSLSGTGASIRGPVGFLLDQLIKFGQNLLLLVLSYLLSRAVSHFQLSQPSSLVPVALAILEKHGQYRWVTMGHTHDPEQYETHGRWFHNTGTWIPIIDTESADVREDKTYTFLRFQRESTGRLRPTFLQRWDDDAGRPERLLLIRRENE